MTTRRILLLSVAIAALVHPACAQKWRPVIQPRGPNPATIVTQKDGGTFADAYANLQRRGLTPSGAYLSTSWCADDKLQTELLEILQRDSPQLLAAALDSAGNMHNPRVVPLLEPCGRALIKSSLGRDANATLAEHGLALYDVSIEKFGILRQGGKVRFCGSAWITFQPTSVVEQTDPNLFRRADVVIRARVLEPRGACDKYCTVAVEKLSTFKAPLGVKVPDRLTVSYSSSGPELPVGEATLYLVRYNPDQPKLGWKLLPSLPSAPPSGFSHRAIE